MNASSRKSVMPGPSGVLEILREEPDLSLSGPHRGVAVIAHPHPLFGGTMDNKVVQTLARAFVLCGWSAVRFNFRGVGGSAGIHDDGRGELEDLLAVVGACAAQGPLALAGFSFGAFVASTAVARLHAERTISQVVLVGTATGRFPVAPIATDLHARSLVIHGELDDTVPLATVFDWARPQSLPITVIPGGSHFFHGQLGLLRSLVVHHLRSPS